MVYLTPLSLTVKSANKVPVVIKHYESYQWYDDKYDSTEWGFNTDGTIYKESKSSSEPFAESSPGYDIGESSDSD